MYWDHVRNYVRSNIVQSEENGPLFSWVDINPTELCNRTCEFCPRGENYPNQDLHMSLPIIEKISQDLHDVDFMGVVNICGNGEPLLSKNIYSLIESLSGDNVDMVTNCDTLSESIIEEIFNLGLSHLNVSCYDGEEQIDYFNGLFAGVGISSEWYTLREYWKPLPGLNNRAGGIDVGNSFVDKPCYYMHYSIQVDWNGDGTVNSSDSEGFHPIGHHPNSLGHFQGEYDGGGHNIDNLYINRPNSEGVGMFGFTGNSSAIKNLSLTGFSG